MRNQNKISGISQQRWALNTAVRTLPTTVERTWWKHNHNVMRVEVVVANGMVGLGQATNRGCVTHNVKHIIRVANRTTSQISAGRRVKINEAPYSVSRANVLPWMPSLCIWYSTQQITTAAKRWKQHWSHYLCARIQDMPKISPPPILPGSESTLTVV